MSLTWEPRWEPYVVEYAGMRFRTCRDKITKIIACPICLNAVKACIEGSEPPANLEKMENAFFFSVRDLILHIKSHKNKQWVRERKTVSRTLVEEEEE